MLCQLEGRVVVASPEEVFNKHAVQSVLLPGQRWSVALFCGLPLLEVSQTSFDDARRTNLFLNTFLSLRRKLLL